MWEVVSELLAWTTPISTGPVVAQLPPPEDKSPVEARKRINSPVLSPVDESTAGAVAPSSGPDALKRAMRLVKKANAEDGSGFVWLGGGVDDMMRRSDGGGNEDGETNDVTKTK